MLYGQSFPPYSVTVFDTAASQGYYFISPKLVLSTSGILKETHMILDKYGEVIYYRDWPFGVRASDFKIQPNGLMTYSDDYQFFLMDSTFTIIDTVAAKNGLNHDEHDIQILPNGHFLFLASEKIQMDLSSYFIFKHNQVPGSANAMVTCNVIQEQDTGKEVVFEWHSRDFFSFDDTDSAYLYDTNSVDWTHSNAIELDVDGHILLSSRQFNEITKINRNDSSIIWRLGGNKNQFSFINDSFQFKMQHDIRRLPNGNITLFDNGIKSPFHPAIAKEYKIDETLKTAELVWNYTYDSTRYSKSRGNVQRLASGQTMVNYGRLDGENILFNCVDTTGQSIIEVRFVDSLLSYRAFNYPVLPWSINRPVISCMEGGGQIFLSVDSGLSSYIWNTGDTTFKIAVTATDTFYVFVPRGNGGFIRSESYILTDITNPCNFNSTPVNSISSLLISLTPNPVSGELWLQLNKDYNQALHIEILDAIGKLVFRQKYSAGTQLIIPVNFLTSGLYFFRVNGMGQKFIKY